MAEAGSPKWAVLNRLTPYLKLHKLRIFLGFTCALLTNGLLVANPWVIKYAIDSLYQSVTWEKLGYYASILILLTLGQGLFRLWTRWLIIGVSRDIEYLLRNDLFTHLERLPLAFYQKNKTGDLMS